MQPSDLPDISPIDKTPLPMQKAAPETRMNAAGSTLAWQLPAFMPKHLPKELPTSSHHGSFTN